MANILIIDSIASIRQLISFALTGSGFEVSVCSDEVCVFEKIQQQKFDLVLTGLNTPKMTSLDLTKELRAIPDFGSTPIVVVSTQAGAEVMQEGKQVGVTDWLIKPFNPQTLIATIKNNLHPNADCSSFVN
ncbi:MAG: response regulator [Methylophaga sp.]|nr:MAG: response regulator [Methylophaga sp.]